MAKTRKSRNPIDCTMSLGDHLEELRARLILAVLGLLIGSIVSLIFGKQILGFIRDPYERTMKQRRAEIEIPKMKSEAGAFVEMFFTNLTRQLATDPNAPSIHPQLIAFVEKVSMETVEAWVQKTQATTDGPGEMIVTSPAEAFTTYMKVSIIAGLILTSPWVFYQIWMFVAAGLYESERKYIHTAIPFSTGLFIIGALFFLFFIAPKALGFFLWFGDVVGAASMWTLQRYISFITLMMLVFGIAFQTPIAVFILARTGLVPIATLRSVRKYVLLGMAFVAAVATPSADIFSMVALLIPLYLLYELGIILAALAERKEQEAGSGTTSD